MNFLAEDRKNPTIPYVGYYEDVKSVLCTINRHPPKNLIHDFLNQSWKSNEGTNFVETAAMRRILMFKDNLAERLFLRHCKRLCANVFKAWFQFSFKYISVRKSLLSCYHLKYISRRFFAWRYVAKLIKNFRRIMRIHWYKQRLIRFRWWKLWTQWERHKENTLFKHFHILVGHQHYQESIERKWIKLTLLYTDRKSAMKIQRKFRSYQMKYHFWAKKTIKILYMKWFGIKLIKMRKHKERIRSVAEEKALNRVVDVGHDYMRKLLETSIGKEQLYTYLREVNDRQDDVNKDMLFPDKTDMPELGMLWTVRAKAMHVLRCRTGAEVIELAKIFFRESRPPTYVCPRCDEKFSIVVAARHHRLHCKYRDPLPSYISWKLCQPLVDAALQPLADSYYKQRMEVARRKQEERFRQILRQDEEARRLDRSLQLPVHRHVSDAALPTPKPKYENTRIKKSTSSFKIW